MNHVYRFMPEKNCELDVCKNCYFETKPKRLKYDSFEIRQDNTKDKVKKINNKPKKNETKKKSKKRKKGKKK